MFYTSYAYPFCLHFSGENFIPSPSLAKDKVRNSVSMGSPSLRKKGKPDWTRQQSADFTILFLSFSSFTLTFLNTCFYL